METLLRRLHPSEDFTKEIGIHITRDNWTLEGALGSGEAPESESNLLGSSLAGPSSLSSVNSGIHAHSTPVEAPERHDVAVILDDNMAADTPDDMMAAKLSELDQTFKSMHMASYIGKAGFFKAAFDAALDGSSLHSRPPPEKFARAKFWTLLPWERATYEIGLTAYDFPDPDLFKELINAYFENVNILFPVLHRPTFQKHLRLGLHLHQEAFGAVVLLVCANGARYISDKRVLLETDEPDSWLSAGWRWFTQVGIAKKLMVSASRLHDLQIYCLGCIYIAGASRTSVLWNMVGTGICLAQEIGLHKKAVYSETPTAEDEQFKRAFWVLYCLDRWVCTLLGRTSLIQDENVDTDLPIDCDDEYWNTSEPSAAFRQPSGMPSRLSYFICAIKLSRISGLVTRIVYGSAKTKALFNLSGPGWEDRLFASFDSMFNKCTELVPYYLSWSPNREDDTFFWQSAHLYAHYYQTQMQLHRPFIHSQKKSTSFMSLAVCINSARSSSSIADAVCNRIPARICPFILDRTTTAAFILMLGIWRAQKAGLEINPEQEMERVHKCMRVATLNESHWHQAGRFWDGLCTVLSAAELPAPVHHTQRQKRRLDEVADDSRADVIFAFANAMFPAGGLPAYDRTVTGSSRMSSAIQRASPPQTPSTHDSTFLVSEETPENSTLPTSTADLSRISDNDSMIGSTTGAFALDLSANRADYEGDRVQIPFVFGSGSGASFYPLDFGVPSTLGDSGQTDEWGTLPPGLGIATPGSMDTLPQGGQPEQTYSEWDAFLSQLYSRDPLSPSDSETQTMPAPSVRH